MVFTVAQVTACFEDFDQMAIPHDTVTKRGDEGIDHHDGLKDFDGDKQSFFVNDGPVRYYSFSWCFTGRRSTEPSTAALHLYY